MFNNFRIAALLAALTVLGACAKIPQDVVSPSFSIKAMEDEDGAAALINFTGGLRNENDSTVFLNVRGEVYFVDKDKKNLITLPFSIPSMLPFETGIIQRQVRKEPDQVKPFLRELGLDFDSLLKSGEVQNLFPDERKIILKNLSLEKKNIVDVLKGKKQ